MEQVSSRDTPEHRHAARVSAARAVVKISGKLGLPVEPELEELAREKTFRERRDAELEELAQGRE